MKLTPLLIAFLALTMFFLSACSLVSTPPLPTPVPTVPATVTRSFPPPTQTITVGGITNVVVKVVQEQGSGEVCSAKATYFVTVDITSNGPTSAKYEISATDGSGQVADGVFDKFASPYVADGMTFPSAKTNTVSLRLIGPYSYPNSITIRTRVNGGTPQSTQVACK